MNITKQNRKDDRVSLTIEISPEELEKAFDKAFVKVSKNAKIPGFRKGKVPRHLFERHYGKEVIIQEGVIDAVNAAYGDAIQSADIPVIDQPQNLEIGEYKENETLSFSLEVDVRPEVKLGKYKGLKATKDSDEVTEDDVMTQLNGLLEQHADFNTSDDALKEDDIVRCDVIAKIGDEEISAWTRKNVGMKVGNGHYGSDFDAQIVGQKAGNTTTFSVDYSEDFGNSDVAGKKVDFEVAVQEVKTRQLPELTDEFVMKVTNNEVASAEALKQLVRDDLEAKKTQEVEQKLHGDLIEKACEDAKVTIQQVLIDRQVDQNVKEFEQDLSRSGIKLDQYLSMVGKQIENFRETFVEGATKQVKAELVLDAIQDKEKIEAVEDDYIAEVRKHNIPNVESDDDARDYISKMPLDGLKYMIERRKTVDFLVQNAKIK